MVGLQPDPQAALQKTSSGPAQVPYQVAIENMQMLPSHLLSWAYLEWNQPLSSTLKPRTSCQGLLFSSLKPLSYQAIPICQHQ